MDAGNMRVWERVRQPPKEALKQIEAGRLKNKTDINPQWRYQSMTEVFGPCGIGWKYEVVRVWREDATGGEVFAFAEVRVYVRSEKMLPTARPDTGPNALLPAEREALTVREWSDPIPGIGGSMLIEQEARGLHVNDEGYKMAITDALSVALKMLGVAADVYAGLWDGSKYAKRGASASPPASGTACDHGLQPATEADPFGEGDTPSYPGIALPPAGTKGINDVRAMLGHAMTLGWDEGKVLAWVAARTDKAPKDLSAPQAGALLAAIKLEVKSCA